MGRILIIEDDRDIAQLLEIHIRDLGYTTEVCPDGLDGLKTALEYEHEMIVLDIMLPSMDGFEVCKRLRMKGNKTPILMLTSKSEELDKVLGLELGADDYLTKPFSIREMTARVKAILRRSKMGENEQRQTEQKRIETEDFVLDLEKRALKVHGKSCELSPKEFQLLKLLAMNHGRTYSRSQLLNLVWGEEFDGFEHTVNSHINRLRAKVELDAQHPEFILTTWGVGYRFKDLDH